MRDNFNKSVKELLAKRVAYICSNPNCRCLTIGPKRQKNGSISIGVAAHITAASEGGPRYKKMSQNERTSYENGIWLCQNCSKIIDSDTDKYTVELLNDWKLKAEEDVRDLIGKRIK